MNNIWSAIRESIQRLYKVPVFSLTIIFTLALGIGANGTIFTAINSVLLKPLAYPDSEKLALIYNIYPKSSPDFGTTSVPDYLDRQQQLNGLDNLFIYSLESFNLTLGDSTQRVLGYKTSADMFATLKVQPKLGKPYLESHATQGKDKVVVISDELWSGIFNSDPAAIGKTLRLHGDNYTVLGVMPKGFIFPDKDTKLWVPFVITAAQRSDQERVEEFSSSIGRLKAGVSIEQLNAQMDIIAAHNLDRIAGNTESGASVHQYLESSGLTGRAELWHTRLTQNPEEKIWLLKGAVLLVLLIACANVANLQLVRLTGRQRELSLRSALGAGINRLITQQLLESILLAFAGALVAILVALVGVQLIKLVGLELPGNGLQLAVNIQTLTYMFVIAVLSGLGSAVVPILVLKRMRFELLREGGRGSVGLGSSKWLQQSLVVMQTALALTLLLGSALMLRSFINLQNVDPGFNEQNVLSAYVALPDNRYPDDIEKIRFYQRLKNELNNTSILGEVGIGSHLPFAGGDWNATYSVEGETLPDQQPSRYGHIRIVDRDYFDALGIELLQGRYLNNNDDSEAPAVVMVDEYMAGQVFPNQDPIGQKIMIGGGGEAGGWRTIVGVVDSVHHHRLDQAIENETLYFPYQQNPLNNFAIIARPNAIQTTSVEQLTSAIRRSVQTIDPQLPLYRIRSMQTLMNDVLVARQAPMLLLVAFALMALVLATISIYSVLSFMVAQRRQEIGVRMAIGARAQAVVQMVLLQGGRMLGTGCVVGVIAALALGHVLSAQLFGVTVVDIPSYLLVITMIIVVGLLACWWPARRASKVQPTEALRCD